MRVLGRYKLVSQTSPGARSRVSEAVLLGRSISRTIALITLVSSPNRAGPGALRGERFEARVHWVVVATWLPESLVPTRGRGVARPRFTDYRGVHTSIEPRAIRVVDRESGEEFRPVLAAGDHLVASEVVRLDAVTGSTGSACEIADISVRVWI